MSVDKGKKITVCVLVYNHAHILESTVSTIQKQSLNGYNIIISDDCSTDNTWQLLQRISSLDPNVTAIRTPHNLGMPGNANFAISHSDRPYIALLHHDDLCRSDLLEKWFDVIDRYQDVGFVFNSYGVYESEQVFRYPMPGDYLDGPWLLEKVLFPRWGCVVRGTAMIRRSAWDSVGGMRTQFGLLADVDLWMRLSAIGPVGYVDEPVQQIRHSRPEDYPEEYKYTEWTWSRFRCLYEIHVNNHYSYYNIHTISGWLRWMGFRSRVSIETTKWLTYGVLRRRADIIRTSQDSLTSYDLWPLVLYRKLLIIIFRLIKI